MRKYLLSALLTSILAVQVPAVRATSKPSPQQLNQSRIVLRGQNTPGKVAQYERFEVDFDIENSGKAFAHWPYDTQPPNGIPAGVGTTVDAQFIDPRGKDYLQPAFYYQEFQDEVWNGHDWHYPTDDFHWKVRFSPNQAGIWKYRIRVHDRLGTSETPIQSFTVTPSSSRGFVRVSKIDPRYFEFEDGSLFTGLGFQFPEYLDDPESTGAPAYAKLNQFGVNFVRLWISSIYGSAWNPYVGGRNHYRGYLPVTGLVPISDERSGEKFLAMRIDYEPQGDERWFDACRLEWFNDPESVKPNTSYRVRALYKGFNISGPRNRTYPHYGFVVKLGGMFANCYEPGTSRSVTGYGQNNSEWSNVDGIWNSGKRRFLPKLHLALENVREGVVYLRSISIQEVLGQNRYGPEILVKPSMEHELYIPQEKAYSFDKILREAERNGVYLKLVAMEKSDEVYEKIEDDGNFITARDNRDGFYGIGRRTNKTRWLQKAWWRYMQARWGYSTNIHSWELTNEGDPNSTKHFELADEFGKYMHYEVFGVEPSDRTFNHPNDHLVSTSFWHSFPAKEFWGNPEYPNIDYADIHAYISTTYAPPEEKMAMISDAARYHLWHSQDVASTRLRKPVVRGEAGLDLPGRQDEHALGLERDLTGLWLHNFLWSSLDSGGLYELYWWRSHIWGHGRDHRENYKILNTFLSDIQLNRGGYVDWSGSVDNSSIRVVGQKNLGTGRMHLWIQNRNHTWKKVSEGSFPEPVSGNITVPGFEVGMHYRIEWWDTYEANRSVLNSEDLVVDSHGNLTFGINSLKSDVAVKVFRNDTVQSASMTLKKHQKLYRH